MNHNLFQKLRDKFPADLNKPWLVIPNGESITYEKLDHMTAKYAGALIKIGIQKGDRILVKIEKTPEALFLYLATLRIGAVYIPLNSSYTSVEVIYFFENSQPSLFITDPKDESQLRDILKEKQKLLLLTLSADENNSFFPYIYDASPSHKIESVAGDEIASIIYTSGTTGLSKGAMLSHDNLASNAQTLNKLWGFSSKDVLIHSLPIYHIHGLFVALHCAMLSGIEIRFLKNFDPELIIKELYSCTVMMGVPTHYIRLLKNKNFSKECCSNMRLFISGSAPLLPNIWTKFLSHTGHKILERYGMSEAGMIASNPLKGERKPGSVGLPLENIIVRIRNSKNKTLPNKQTGILQVKGPNVFKGYWQMPSLSKTEFTSDNFFITGDLANINDNGEITIIGRSKDLIISGGLNVYPKNIEDIINSIEGILESAVIGAPHQDLGEGVIAIVCADPEFNIDGQTIKNNLRSSLAGFKIPKKIIFVENLPKNTMGKIQKNILRQNFCHIFHS